MTEKSCIVYDSIEGKNFIIDHHDRNSKEERCRIVLCRGLAVDLGLCYEHKEKLLKEQEERRDENGKLKPQEDWENQYCWNRDCDRLTYMDNLCYVCYCNKRKRKMHQIHVVPLRGDEERIDEIQSEQTSVHIEKMTDNEYFVGIGGATFRLRSKSKIKLTMEDEG